MINYLPQWLMKKYAKLWNKFGSRIFTREQAQKLFGKKDSSIAVVLSDLRKNGWLEMHIDQKDARKNIYNLINPEKGFKEIIKTVNKRR